MYAPLPLSETDYRGIMAILLTVGTIATGMLYMIYPSALTIFIGISNMTSMAVAFYFGNKSATSNFQQAVRTYFPYAPPNQNR